MLTSVDRVGVAVSGGADSVVLLKVLHELSAHLPVEFLVLHMNHHLRGEASEVDEQFVRTLAESLGLPFVVAHSFPGLSNDNLESAARQERREFFRGCQSAYRLQRIALGHSQSDQAETVLHRLLRGTGLRGLAAMRPVGPDGEIRPLLRESRGDIRAWATASGITWREDGSNSDLRFTRNRLRLKTIPELASDYNPHLERALAHTAALAQAEEDYWEEQVRQTAAEITERTRLGSIFQIDHLMRLPLALRRRVVRHTLDEIRRPGPHGLEFDHIEQILALCTSNEGHERAMAPGVEALRSYDRLLLFEAGRLSAEPRGYSLQLPFGQTCELPYGAGSIRVERMNSEDAIYVSFKEDRVHRVLLGDVAVGQDSPVVRNWEPGDALLRPSPQALIKVKSLFQERKVLLWERRHWPVLVMGGKIVWTRQM